MNFSDYYHLSHDIEPNTISQILTNNEVRFYNSSFILFFSFVYTLMLSIMFHCHFPNYHSFFCYDDEIREQYDEDEDDDDTENKSKSTYYSCFSLLSLTKYNSLQMYEHKYKMEMLKYLISSSSSSSSICVETTCENRMIMELTPLGNVVLKYDDKTQKFIYYSDHIIPYRFLQTVARAYALRFSCFHIFQEDWVQDKKEKEKEKEKNENWILFSFFPFMKQETLFDDIYHFNEVYSQAKGKHEFILKEEEERILIEKEEKRLKEDEDEEEEEEEEEKEEGNEEEDEEEVVDEDYERKKETMIEDENKKNKMVNHYDTSKLFAKFKSYNNKTSIATANSMFSSPGKHRPDCEFSLDKSTTSSGKTKEKKKEIKLNKSNQIEKSINMFSYQGKLVNFSFLQKIPLKKVDKIKSMNFSDFKKLKLQLPSTCTLIKEKK